MVKIGDDGGRPVKTVMGETLVPCGEGALLIALWIMGIVCGQQSWVICNYERTAHTAHTRSLPRRSTAPFDKGKMGV